MKKILSVMLVLAILLTQLTLFAFADAGEWYDPYDGLAIESITVEPQRPLYENVDGFYVTNDNGEKYFYYVVTDVDLYVTVVYENGEVEEGLTYDLYSYFDAEGENQDIEPWGLGKYEAKAYYRDTTCTFEIEVAETPVASVTAVAQNPLVDGWDVGINKGVDIDGEPYEYQWANVWVADPIFTVTLKDGTVYEGDEYAIYEALGHYPCDLFGVNDEDCLVVGKNTVKYEFMNEVFELEIEVLPNPYKSVSIKGENEVYLVFEGVDEKDSFETKIVNVYYYEYFDDYYEATIVTEDAGDFEVDVYFEHTDKPYTITNKNISLEIGSFRTNTLETCNFFKVHGIAERSFEAVTDYSYASNDIVGHQFTGYNADAEINVDDVVALSTYMYDSYENIQANMEYDLYKTKLNDAKANVNMAFGDIDVDVKDSSFYKPLFSRVEVKRQSTNGIFAIIDDITFADGKWTATAKTYDWINEIFESKITIVYYEDGTIYSIDCQDAGIEMGDVNVDGSVTAVDARYILQYVAGLAFEGDFYMSYGDMNGDGEVTAVDARMILRKVAGLQ